MITARSIWSSETLNTYRSITAVLLNIAAGIVIGDSQNMPCQEQHTSHTATSTVVRACSCRRNTTSLMYQAVSVYLL